MKHEGRLVFNSSWSWVRYGAQRRRQVAEMVLAGYLAFGSYNLQFEILSF
jgi:hypothetical protein